MSTKEPEVSWNKKRIFIFVFSILAILIGAFGIYAYQYKINQQIKQDVKGERVSLPKIDLKKNIEEKIVNLQKEAGQINVVDVATSTPQIQKLINDLKALEDYPKSQAKEMCEKVCKNF